MNVFFKSVKQQLMLYVKMLSDILKLLKNDIDVFHWLIFQILNDLMLTLMNNWRNRLIFFESDWSLICSCNWQSKIWWFLLQFNFSIDDYKKKTNNFDFKFIESSSWFMYYINFRESLYSWLLVAIFLYFCDSIKIFENNIRFKLIFTEILEILLM